jgi:hypothetical protein
MIALIIIRLGAEDGYHTLIDDMLDHPPQTPFERGRVLLYFQRFIGP